MRAVYTGMLESGSSGRAELESIRRFTDDLAGLGGGIAEYDYELMKQLVSRFTVRKDGRITVEFIGGAECQWGRFSLTTPMCQ